VVVECLFDSYAVFAHGVNGVFVCVDVDDVVEVSAVEFLLIDVESVFVFPELPGESRSG